MSKEETASGRRPSIPEVAVTLQETSNVSAKINLSVEEENALLRERNRQLEADIARKDARISELEERETAHLKDDAETLNVVIEALRAVQPGAESARFFRESEDRIRKADPEDKPLVINARIKAAAAMIRDSPSTAATPEPGSPLRYDTKTLNQKRGEAIAAHAQQTGKAAIKSTEAGTVLETIEGRKLDRKTVHRAMDAARGILRASSEVVGGIRRLVVPSPRREREKEPTGGQPQPVAAGGGGDRGTVPRPRRWAVPWDGED
jgi:hypothetical protein